MSSSQTASRQQAGSGFQPYIGLRPFTEQEKDRFFGRSNETSILLDKIRANRLTLLLAASGVGKSSLLQAGIMPELRTDSNIELIYYNVWSASPQAFKQAVSEHYGESYKEVSLKSILRSCTLFSSGQLILLLDQFEELFNYHRFKPEFQPFIEELSAAVLDRSLPVSFVFSMREDFALELNSFKDSLPGVFDNYFRLEKLTCEQAREAIEKPLEGTGYCFAPKTENQEALLDQVLHDLAKREQERQFGVQELLELKELPLLVEPPHLQIVCQELWQRHLDETVKQITHVAYEKAGRTAGILNYYFLGKIDLFSKKEQALASTAFDHLVGTRAIKIAHPLERLVELTRADAEDLQSVLDRLQNYAILRRQKRGEEFWYELYHDIFSESIDRWNREFKSQQRVKRLACGAAAVVFAGGVLFAGNNWRVNHDGRYLQLSPKATVSDRVEVYEGRPIGNIDIFNHRNFLYETLFHRQEIEADRRFNQVTIGEKPFARQEFITRLPISDRFSRYMQDGLYSRGRKLAKNILGTQDSGRIAELVSQFSRIRSKKIVGELNELFKDNDGNVRSAAVDALGQLSVDSAIPHIIPLLKDSDGSVRSAAVDALSQLGVASAVPQIIPLLKDSDESVRSAVVDALVQLGVASAVPHIIPLLKDSDESVQSAVVDALVQLGVASAVPQIIPLLKDSDESVQSAVVKVLVQLGVASAVPQIIPLLKDSDGSVRSAAVKVLVQLGVASAVSHIIP
ncbi:HEAT repeat domain-containing protein, partial [Desulfobulbus sp. US4]|nr:HEAT repeat domain-containing protein [Desulfobulbus sp. US4]